MTMKLFERKRERTFQTEIKIAIFSFEIKVQTVVLNKL